MDDQLSEDPAACRIIDVQDDDLLDERGRAVAWCACRRRYVPRGVEIVGEGEQGVSRNTRPDRLPARGPL
jgi:hypothetical protein